MLYVPSDNLGSPLSLLEAFTLMNKGYYILFASYYYVNGRFFSFDGFSLAPGRFAYQNSLNGNYPELVANDILEHWKSLGCPKNYRISEMGFAEGLFLAKVLDIIKEKEPRFYEAITVYAIDFTREYEEHQLINLKNHLSKVFFIRENVFSISKIAKLDYVILNELLDDLPATSITRINGSLYLEAFCKRFYCSDRQGDIVLIPISDLEKYPNLIKDYDKIENYKKRLGFSNSEEGGFIAYLGIEQFFSNLSDLIKPNSRIWVMDYFRRVPNITHSIGTGISVEHNIGDFCNLTVHLDYFHLEKIARSFGFSIKSFEEIGQRFSYPRTYNVLILQKN